MDRGMTTCLYKIVRWAEVYETAETRKLKALQWVPLPNKLDGLGFRRLAAERDNCVLLATWVLIVEVASRGPPEQRGVLARNGVPMTAEDLALITGFAQQAFERAFDFFSHPKQGWLVIDDPKETSATPATASVHAPPGPGSPAETSAAPASGNATASGTPGSAAPPPGTPADDPANPAESPAIAGDSAGTPVLNGMEGNGREGNGKNEHEPGHARARADGLMWSELTGFAGVTDLDREAWRQAYPACDIDRQLAAMHEWLRSNPEKAHKKRWRRFVTNWLSRQQERGGDKPANQRANGASFAQRRAELARML